MNVAKALGILKSKGYKYTGKREEMIRIFAREKRYLTAKELLEYMQEDFPNLSFDTIYRNLSLFEDLKLIETTELNGERIYRLSCDADQHHHHIICTQCGKTKKIDLCPMDAVAGALGDFKIIGHKFEVYGHCDKCDL